MMFPMVLPLPRTSASFCTGFPPCFLWQTASAATSSGLSLGAFPAKTAVPLMVDAATETPGYTKTATNPATSHNPFRVPRMFSSFGYRNLVSVVAVDAARSHTCGGLYTDPRHPSKTRSPPLPSSVDRSGVFERQRLGQPWIAERYERLPSHQPARRRHEAPADSDERGHVQYRHAQPFGMQRRHHLPVEIQVMHREKPRSADGQRQIGRASCRERAARSVGEGAVKAQR